jgi:hypothetical protein
MPCMAPVIWHILYHLFVERLVAERSMILVSCTGQIATVLTAALLGGCGQLMLGMEQTGCPLLLPANGLPVA